MIVIHNKIINFEDLQQASHPQELFIVDNALNMKSFIANLAYLFHFSVTITFFCLTKQD